MSTLLERTRTGKGNAAETWKPELPGDLIVGVVREVKRETTQYGENLVLRIVAEEVSSGGKELEPGLYLVWGRAILTREVDRLRVQEGDAIGIKFVGEAKKGAAANRAKDFAVEVEYHGIPFADRPHAVSRAEALAKEGTFSSDEELPSFLKG